MKKNFVSSLDMEFDHDENLLTPKRVYAAIATTTNYGVSLAVAVAATLCSIGQIRGVYRVTEESHPVGHAVLMAEYSIGSANEAMVAKNTYFEERNFDCVSSDKFGERVYLYNNSAEGEELTFLVVTHNKSGDAAEAYFYIVELAQ